MLNIIENNSLYSRIYLIIALFFLVTASNGYACNPRGHIKFHNRTKIPITVTAIRKEDRFSPEHKKCLEQAQEDKKKKRKVRQCRLKQIKSNVIVVKPGKTTSGICWSERKKHGIKFYFIKELIYFKTSFNHNNNVLLGPVLKVSRNYFSTSEDNTGRIDFHLGNQSVIRSVGCSSFSLICTVDFKMNKKNR